MKRLTKEEQAYLMKDLNERRKMYRPSTESSVSIICNYANWKDEGFSDNRLVEYDTQRREYQNYMFVDGLINKDYLKQLSNRLWDECGFKVEDNYHDPKKVLNRKSPYYIYEKAELELQNAINELSTALLTIHFNVLLDFGFSKKKMDTNMQYITKRMNEVIGGNNGNGTKALDWHKELFEERGIYIELPERG